MANIENHKDMVSILLELSEKDRQLLKGVNIHQSIYKHGAYYHHLTSVCFLNPELRSCYIRTHLNDYSFQALSSDFDWLAYIAGKLFKNTTSNQTVKIVNGGLLSYITRGIDDINKEYIRDGDFDKMYRNTKKFFDETIVKCVAERVFYSLQKQNPDKDVQLKDFVEETGYRQEFIEKYFNDIKANPYRNNFGYSQSNYTTNEY
jgi:hypothetical protein